MTKIALILEFSRQLHLRYEWAKDAQRLNVAMIRTLTEFRCGKKNTAIDGEAFRAAWKAIGCKGKPTYRAIFDLPDDPNKKLPETQK